MREIEAVLLEPVGCLAEFPAEPFNEIAARFFDRRKSTSKSGSRSYWHLLNLMEAADTKREFETLELQAVEGASVYEDVVPALSQLKAMGVELVIASSLSDIALRRFIDEYGLCKFFSAVWGRDSAGGVKAIPLVRASVNPEQTIFLTDTAAGLKVAKYAGVNGILMMNDPDAARRLAMQEPAGGIVSLHELPDFVRLVSENTRLGPLARNVRG
jgi:phosphoglycolate phosphatase-like HAD superfamily hydrolase